MAIIYRKTDRIWVNIHDIQIAIAPLSYHEKSEISKLMVDGKIASAAVASIKACLKDIKGLKRTDGTDYRLEFDGDKLSEESVDDLMNLEHSKDMILVCLKMLANVPDEFTDAETGKPLEGVSIVKENKPGKK